MRSRWRWQPFTVSLTMLATATCGGAGGAADPEAYVDALVQQYCDRGFACEASWNAPDQPFSDEFGTSPANCMEIYGTLLAPILTSIEAGRIAYDASAAEVCLASVDDGTCEEFFAGETDPPECDATFRGTVEAGDPCVLDVDCTAGYCAMSGGTGTCAAF